MSDVDAEALIAHLAGGLAREDRDAFRRAAESALANAPTCLGPGLIHRIVVSTWRSFFHPPTFEGRATCWESGRKQQSKLIVEGSKDGIAS